MKNKKGFTLIELLGVIVVLSVIALVVTPAVDRVIKSSQDKLYKSQKDNLISSVKSWVSDNKELFANGSTIIITLQDLKELNHINYDIKNPKTNACLSNSMQFKIEKTGKKYVYTIVGDELVDGNDSDCEMTSKNISIYLLGDNPYSIEINSNYTIPGVTATDANGNDLTSIVTSTNNINISVLGNYQVTYKAEYDGFKATKIRNISVVDTIPPVINAPNDIVISKEITSLNLMEGVSASDNSGARIDVNVVEKIFYGIPGEYVVKYVAIDPSGNIATRNRKVTISN